MILRNRVLLLLFCGITHFLSCSKPAVDVKSVEYVVSCTESYYNHLLEGNYEQFLDCTKGGKQMFPSQRRQMLDAVTLYWENLNKKEPPVVEIKGIGAQISQEQAEVYLQFVYADSTKERIVIPMVFTEGRWYIE